MYICRNMIFAQAYPGVVYILNQVFLKGNRNQNLNTNIYSFIYLI